MKEQLAKIRSEALAAFDAAADSAALDALRVQYLGKKGELTGVLKMMGKLSAEERPAMGQLANEVRAALEQAIEVNSKKLEAAVILVNGRPANKRTKLTDGDTVIFMSPVAGG